MMSEDSHVMFSFRQVPRTHPVDRKRKRANLAIIFFLLLSTVLSEDLASTYYRDYLYKLIRIYFSVRWSVLGSNFLTPSFSRYRSISPYTRLTIIYRYTRIARMLFLKS